MLKLKKTYKFQVKDAIYKSIAISGDGNTDIIVTRGHNNQYKQSIIDIYIYGNKIAQIISRPDLEVSNIAADFKGNWVFIGVQNYHEGNKQMGALFTYKYDRTKYVEEILPSSYKIAHDNYGSQILVNYRKNLVFAGYAENHPEFDIEILEYNDKTIKQIGSIALPGDIKKFKLMDINYNNGNIISKCEYKDNTTSISIYGDNNNNKYRNIEVIELPYIYTAIKNVKIVNNTIFALITESGKENIYTLTKHGTKWEINNFDIDYIVKSLSSKKLKRYTVDNIEVSKLRRNNKLFISVFCIYEDDTRKSYVLVYKKSREWKYIGYISSPGMNDHGKKFDTFGNLLKSNYDGKKILTLGELILNGSYETIYIHKYEEVKT